MKVLIHDERPDTLEFFLESIVNLGYKAVIAKDGSEIVQMLSNDQYNVVLTNGGYRELDQHIRLKLPSLFVIGITGSHAQNEDMDLKADLYLRRPFGFSKLRQALEKPIRH
jgi:DNA-binding response OmpR family regulator